MNLRLLTVFLSCAAVFPSVRAADDDIAPKTNVKELLRARMAEEARKAPPPSAPKPPTPASDSTATQGTPAAPTTPAAAAAPVASDKTEKTPPPAKPATPAATAAAPATAAKPPPTTLPKVEVKKDRITVLDQQLAKQEQDIARERKNLKATEVDTALNDAKIAKPLAIFGGESSQFRQHVANERVELMEAEKDILEAIARAKTREEKQELQKQLDEIRSFRRDLEKSLR